MTEPRRIQLKRTKGWRLHDGTVNVARHSSGTSKWGNPFRVGAKVKMPGNWGTEATPYTGPEPPGRYDALGGHRGDWEVRLIRDRADAVALYIAYYAKTSWCEPSSLERIRRELGGRDLACWCPEPEDGQPDICHGAALLAVANGRRPSTPDVHLQDGSKRIHLKRCCNGCGNQLGDVTDAELVAGINGDPLPDVRWECPRCSAILRISPFQTSDEAVTWMRATCIAHLLERNCPNAARTAEHVQPRTLMMYLGKYFGPGQPASTPDILARVTAAALMLELPRPAWETANG